MRAGGNRPRLPNYSLRTRASSLRGGRTSRLEPGSPTRARIGSDAVRVGRVHERVYLHGTHVRRHMHTRAGRRPNDKRPRPRDEWRLARTLGDREAKTVIDTIAFDADDTLWHNESLFRETQAEFRRLLVRYHDEEWIERRLYETEMRNLGHFGYGVKSFMLSMVETAVELTEGRVGGAEVQRILELGRSMLNAPVALIDGVAETLDALASAHELMLITKGDLLDQERKLEASGLRDYFGRVEVVSRKDPSTYRRILARHAVLAERFVMVGDSLRSDVLPVLEVGGWALHVPYPTPWQHELVDEDPALPERYLKLERIADVPASLHVCDHHGRAR